jgi:Ser/Thr protein kinase RdoA (MazF antagonist)
MGLIYLTLSFFNTHLTGLSGSVANFHYYLAAPPEEDKEFWLDSLENQITALENKCSGDYQWIGFCHNDLQNGNIMIDEKTNVLTIIVSDTSTYF